MDPLWYLPKPVTLDDFQKRIQKFEAFPLYAKQVTALLRAAKAAGMLPAHQLASPAIMSAGRWLNDKPGLMRDPFAANTGITEAERTLYAPFESMDGVDTADRAQLQEAARKAIRERVIPALEEYHDALSGEYLPACPASPSLSQWPNGGDVYGVLLRLSTTTKIDPRQVQDFGAREVRRIREEMAALLPATGFKGSLDEFLVHARSDPEFYFSNGEELLAAYRGAIRQIEPVLPKAVHDIPKLNIQVEGVHGGAAASYEAPNAKHAYDLVNVEIGEPGIHPKFEVIPLMLHEGLPGHALQHAVGREFDSKATDAIAVFERQARQSTGFGEGWGLYAESLGQQLELYQTPMDKFGALRMELTRAVRIVVDTGVHLSGWTLQQAKAYAAANTGEPEAQIELEVQRTIRPGVQPAYTIGEREIVSMRDMAAKRLGEEFDLRAFDDAMLRWGPLPLEVMRRKLGDCLDDRQCSETLGKTRPL